MVERNRRVEPRTITGTGMTADPENIQELQEKWDKFQRINRDKPKKSFDEVREELKQKNKEVSD